MRTIVFVTGAALLAREILGTLVERYREDVDQVVEVLREIGEGMQADEEFGAIILEPLEVLGLDSFGASSVNNRIRLKTLPIKQWAVKREYQRRMKGVFDERGIEIPFPHQTVYFGADKDRVAPAARIALDNAARADLGTPPSETPGPPEGEPERSERNWCRVTRRPRASPFAASRAHRHTGLVIEMVEEGIVEPRGDAPSDLRFTGRSLIRAQKALNLARDLRVNWPGAALALDLLEEIERLRVDGPAARNRIQGFRTPGR